MARASDDNLDGYTSKELQELLPRIEAHIREKRAAEQRALKDELAARASELGFSLDDLFGGRKHTGGKGKAEVKYRNPENPDETWVGRGRMPTWLAEKLKKRGVKMEDFAV